MPGLPASPQVTTHLFIFLLGAGLVGFLLGAAREWLREGRVRSTARKATKEAEALKAKVDELTRDADDDIPALPSRRIRLISATVARAPSATLF